MASEALVVTPNSSAVMRGEKVNATSAGSLRPTRFTAVSVKRTSPASRFSSVTSVVVAVSGSAPSTATS